MRRQRPIRISLGGDAAVAARWRWWAEKEAKRKQRIFPERARGQIKIAAPDLVGERVYIELRRLFPEFDELFIIGYALGGCEFNLRSGLMYYGQGYFPLDLLWRDPGTLYPGAGTEALKALNPAMDGHLVHQGNGVLKTSTLIDPIFYGISETEYTALEPEAQALAMTRITARRRQDQIARDLDMYPERTRWWLSSLISQPDPARIPPVDNIGLAGQWGIYAIPGGDYLRLSDTVLAYVEPPPPDAEEGATGRWRYLLLRMPTASTPLLWRRMTLSPCAQALLDASLATGQTGLRREAIERYAMTDLTVDPEHDWQDAGTPSGIDLNWSDQGFSPYPWTDNLGRGGDWRSRHVVYDKIYAGSAVAEYQTRCYEIRLEITHTWVAEELRYDVLIVPVGETVASGAISWPVGEGAIWAPDMLFGGAMVHVNAMASSPAQVADVPPPAGSAPVAINAVRLGPDDVRLDIVWASASSVAPGESGNAQIPKVCGFTEARTSYRRHSGGVETGFSTERWAGNFQSLSQRWDVEYVASNTYRYDKQIAIIDPYPNQFVQSSEVCDLAQLQATIDAIDAHDWNGSSNKRSYQNRQFGRYERTMDQRIFGTATGCSMCIFPFFSRRLVYMGGSEYGNANTQVTVGSFDDALGAIVDGYTYESPSNLSNRVNWPTLLYGTTLLFDTDSVQEIRAWLDWRVELLTPRDVVTLTAGAQYGVPGAQPPWLAWMRPALPSAGGNRLEYSIAGQSSHQGYAFYNVDDTGVFYGGTGGYLPNAGAQDQGTFGFIGAA